MNTKYLELQDKVIVIDENGNTINRENKGNVEKILVLENRIEKLDSLIEKYEKEISELNQDNIYTKKISKKMFLLGIIGNIVGILIIFIESKIYNVNTFNLRSVLFGVLGTIGIPSIYCIGTALDNVTIKREDIPRLARLIETLRSERIYLNKELNNLKSMDIKPAKVNVINHNFIPLHDHEFDEYIETTIEVLSKEQPKKKVRKLR